MELVFSMDNFMPDIPDETLNKTLETLPFGAICEVSTLFSEQLKKRINTQYSSLGIDRAIPSASITEETKHLWGSKYGHSLGRHFGFVFCLGFYMKKDEFFISRVFKGLSYIKLYYKQLKEVQQLRARLGDVLRGKHEN